VSWIPLALLVVSLPLSAVFIIGFYSEGLFHVPLALVTRERHTGHWFVNMFFVRFPPNYEAPSLYLMLTDERFLNVVLSTGLLPSTSAHLF
jgi:hypothetical protein